jgi:DNA repair photolyase
MDGKLRWPLATDAPRDGQMALFDPAVEHHIGTGEFRGLEFLHVNAKRIINEVPGSSPLPFRYTINAYRGCSHACAYCIGGDTPILLADGRTERIATLAIGEFIYGTERRARDRRCVVTRVIDKWATVKPGFCVTLQDGTELIASADHRFLSDGGWKHVTGAESGARQRPHLACNNKLVGVADLAAITRKRTIDGVAIKSDARLGVRSIEPLGIDLPMYDITTGTGDFIANGVVSHNCFARPTHEYLNLDAGRDFETKIVVKINAVERLRAELAAKRWAGDPIAMGTNTDPYQRCEGKYRLTRGIVEVLAEHANPFSILTKGTLILRDIDVLTEAARRTKVATSFSIGTLDPQVWKASEPGTPHPRQRVEAVAKLNTAGVPCSVLVAPILPGISDAPAQLAEVVRACVDAGAPSITPIVLHLRTGVREQFMPWLSAVYPEHDRRYADLYPRAYAPKAYQARITGLVRRLVDEARAEP